MLSVLMPVWNGARYLATAIESILNQTYRDFEFLIVDDGSTDETPSILADYARRDPRIRVLRQEHNGLVVALNHGLAESRGEWVARMDCDDVAHPRRLEFQMRAAKKHPSAVLCHTQVRYIGDPRYETRSARMVRSRAMMTLALCYKCPISHPSVLYCKNKVLEAGGYRAEDPHVEDYSLWGRLIELGDFVAINQPLLDLRLHDSSVSKVEADTQATLSSGIALGHCRKFMQLDETAARKALAVLRAEPGCRGLGDWYWFLRNCLPRMERTSPEIWLWAAQSTVRRLGRMR
jgi:glycosyltransferase involved in cell wall biosynthesis